MSHLVARWIVFGDGYEVAELYDVFVLGETFHFGPKASVRCGSSQTSDESTKPSSRSSVMLRIAGVGRSEPRDLAMRQVAQCPLYVSGTRFQNIL